MKLRSFTVDAFAERPFEGNPAVVVPLESWLPDALLQAMAAEHNLSETAFIVPEARGNGGSGTAAAHGQGAPTAGEGAAAPAGHGAQWHLRWFTPTVEVELCGHATLATAHVLASEFGITDTMRFRTRSGLLGVERDGDRYVLDFPAMPPVPSRAPPGLATALGAVPREVWKARDWICVFDDPAVVRDLRPDHVRIASLPDTHEARGTGSLIATAPVARTIATAPGGESGYDVVSRYFGARIGINEDPVTGAAHTELVPFWAARLGRNSLVCRQVSARGGTLWCELRGDRVRIGGHAVLYAQSEITLP
ncbi:PhzF family phenazine biosynthesis protein [Roseomonas sp. BN140053]|uniref:PhzF family phenazine biosynthesis protein n=1 Tax=Roseomonas sp. BN140053 TaxID=3391898 RepID=UPI0039EB1ABB